MGVAAGGIQPGSDALQEAANVVDPMGDNSIAHFLFMDTRM